MGDRRQGDRREKEKGIIKLEFKDAIIYLILAAILIISVSANIVLFRRYKEVKQNYEDLIDSSIAYDGDITTDTEPTYEEIN